MSKTDNSVKKSYDNQDWKPCVLSKSVKKTPQKHIDPNVIKMAKLDKSDDVQPIKKVSETDSKLIASSRVEKKISQEDLAKRLCIDKSVIRDIEAGKYNENKALISKIKSCLKKCPTPSLE
jgi:ribosome-binding protein aMBF1 (putative translation factor)